MTSIVDRIATWLHQSLCDHVFYVEDLQWVGGVQAHGEQARIEAPCVRCDKVCSAPYGLALDGRLERRPDSVDDLLSGRAPRQ